MKGNWKSTEFWLNVMTIIGMVCGSVIGLIPADLLVKIIAGLVAVYTIGRTITKLTPTKVDDQFMDKLGEIISKLGGSVPPEVK